MAHSKITATVGYGLRACVDLAEDGGLMSATSLADKGSVSARYLGWVLNRLRKGRIVTSTVGIQGGYRLSRPASRITVGEIIESIEGLPPPIPRNIPQTVRRHMTQAHRELCAIRLSDL